MSSGFNVWRDYDGPDGLRAWMYKTREEKPAAGQARGHRPYGPGPRDHRAQADPGREGSAGQQPPGRALQRHSARARVDRPRGRPALAAVVHRRVAGEQQADQGHAQDSASSGSCSSATRTATSTPSRAPTRASGARTSVSRTGLPAPRSATASTRTATIGRTGTTTTRAPRRRSSSDTYRGPSGGSEPETQAIEGLFNRIDFKLQVELPLLRAVAPLPAGLADRHADRRRPDLLRPRGQPGQPRDPRLQCPGSRPTSST